MARAPNPALAALVDLPEHEVSKGGQVSARLQVALIGAGSMGSNHARVVAQSDVADLAFVVDGDSARGTALADQHGATPIGAVADLPPCDAAIVATSTESHVVVASALLDRGVPLLIEKPMANEFGAVERLVERSAASGVPIMCGFVERFNPVVRTALQILEGPAVHVVALRHSPPAPRVVTSVLWDLLIHDLDLAMQLANGSEVTTVAGASMIPTGFADAELFDATIGFANGLIATMSASRVSHRKVRQLSIETPDMLVELDLVRQDITVWRHLTDEMVVGKAGTYRANTVFEIPFVRSSTEPLMQQLLHFVGLINGSVDQDAERASVLPPHRVAGQLMAAQASPVAGSSRL